MQKGHCRGLACTGTHKRTLHPASPGLVALLVGVSSCRAKGHGFNSWSGHMPRLWVQYPIRLSTRRQPTDLLLIDLLLPFLFSLLLLLLFLLLLFSLSLPLCLSLPGALSPWLSLKAMKRCSSGEDKKKDCIPV